MNTTAIDKLIKNGQSGLYSDRRPDQLTELADQAAAELEAFARAERLIYKWRRKASVNADLVLPTGIQIGYENCADELEVVLTGGAK
jgi:hypothetical protein